MNKVFNILSSRMEECAHLSKIISPKDVNMINIQFAKMDEIVAVACRMLEAKLIKHEQYRKLYEQHIQYIHEKNFNNNLRKVEAL